MPNMLKIISVVCFLFCAVALADVFCPSLPENVQKTLFFLPNNPDTYSCDKCTDHRHCAWCDEGYAVDVYILGKKVDDIALSGFCWNGGPFKLSNTTWRTTDALQTEFTIECNTAPRWRQCGMSGPGALTLFFVLLAVFIGACVAACVVGFKMLRRRRRGYHSIPPTY